MWISEVKCQDPKSGAYLGSPSIVRLPDGDLLASHDYFGRGCPRNMENEEHMSSIYRSSDDGRTWQNTTHITGGYWSSLFVHRDDVYFLGTSAQYGSIVIRRSTNGGYTWTHPKDQDNGLLFPGGPYHDPPNYHCAPVPVLVAKGRLWRAFEDNDPLNWPKGFKSCVISAPADVDLLDASNWTITNKLAYDQETGPPEFGNEKRAAGWLEGNVVEDPDGQLWNILRVHSDPVLNKAAMVKIEDEHTLTFDPATGFIDFPGGMSKFTIRRDPQTGRYWMLCNDMANEPVPIRRNRLSLFCSEDLRNWDRKKVVMEDHYEITPEASVRNTGFQYVDWQFDGDDIMYHVRTAYIGAHNFHDANHMYFCRVPSFREL